KAEAPSSTASRASSSRVMPQIFTLVSKVSLGDQQIAATEERLEMEARKDRGSGSPCSKQDSTILRVSPCAISTVSVTLRPSATRPGTSGLLATYPPSFRASTCKRIATSSVIATCFLLRGLRLVFIGH